MANGGLRRHSGGFKMEANVVSGRDWGIIDMAKTLILLLLAIGSAPSQQTAPKVQQKVQQSVDQLVTAVARRDKPALQELITRAKQGDVKAQFNLGWLYDAGSGVPKDLKQAVDWYRQAAAQGSAEAQNN